VEHSDAPSLLTDVSCATAGKADLIKETGGAKSTSTRADKDLYVKYGQRLDVVQVILVAPRTDFPKS
jgi:hypothetical protein